MSQDDSIAGCEVSIQSENLHGICRGASGVGYIRTHMVQQALSIRSPCRHGRATLSAIAAVAAN